MAQFYEVVRWLGKEFGREVIMLVAAIVLATIDTRTSGKYDLLYYASFGLTIATGALVLVRAVRRGQ